MSYSEHWVLSIILQVIIDALAPFGVSACRSPGFPGVWCEGSKIAQVGISCSKWVTSHGFAINVSPDMSYFDRIVPCGIRDRGVTSMKQLLGPNTPSVADVQKAVQAAFSAHFSAELRVEVDVNPRFE